MYCRYNDCTFLLVDRLYLFSEGYFQYSYGARVALVDFVVKENPEEEKWGGPQVRRVRSLFQFSFHVDEMFSTYKYSDASLILAVWREAPFLLGSKFFPYQNPHNTRALPIWEAASLFQHFWNTLYDSFTENPLSSRDISKSFLA